MVIIISGIRFQSRHMIQMTRRKLSEGIRE